MASNNSHLCGPSFFKILLSGAVPQLSSRKKWIGESNGITEPAMFAGLIKIADPQSAEDFEGESFAKTLSKYKAFQQSTSKYFPFNEASFYGGFDNLMRGRYEVEKELMIDLVQKFLLWENESKMKQLVGTLLELIDGDSSLEPASIFYFGEGKEYRKDQLISSLGNEIELSSFLLAVWHYIVMNVKDSMVGAEDDTPSNLGVEMAKKISVFLDAKQHVETDTIGKTEVRKTVYENEAESVTIDNTAAPEGLPSQNAQFIFNNFGNVGKYESIVNNGTMTINHNYGGGKDDE